MNAAQLSQLMASEASTIAAYLIPEGKRVSGEWKAGSVAGEKGQSLSIRLSGAKAGIWCDFSTGEKGDLLDLWAAVRGLSTSQAMSEAKQYLNIRDTMPPEREQKSFKRPEKPKCHAPKASVAQWLKTRFLTEKTLADFKIAELEQNGKTYAVFPYLRDGVLVNVKYRNPIEKKDMRQESGAEPCLFGWHLIDPKCRTIAITEGEIDAMSLHQCGIPALSVHSGAGNHQWIENDWQRLERFSEILVFFDNDEAGNKGAQEIMHRLGLERCKRVNLPKKDANEWLMEGAEKVDFEGAISDSKPQDPEELKQASDFIGRVKAMFYPAPDSERDPVLRLDKELDWFEFRAGELTVWTGINGHGKSLLLSQVMLGLMAQNERVVIFSGELTPERQLKRMVKQAAGLDRPTPKFIDAIGGWLTDKLWLFNVVGSSSIDRLLEVFLYANKRYGTRHFVIDSLMMTDVPEDGPGAMTAQKIAMQKLCDFVKKNGCHLHLVAHPRKAKDESATPGKMDVAGSNKITSAADNIFSVWAALKDEADGITDDVDGRLELTKNRNGDFQHYILPLWFCKSAQQYTTNSRRRPVSYVAFESPAEVCP